MGAHPLLASPHIGSAKCFGAFTPLLKLFGMTLFEKTCCECEAGSWNECQSPWVEAPFELHQPEQYGLNMSQWGP